jgi:hypothetical protein
MAVDGKVGGGFRKENKSNMLPNEPCTIQSNRERCPMWKNICTCQDCDRRQLSTSPPSDTIDGYNTLNTCFFASNDMLLISNPNFEKSTGDMTSMYHEYYKCIENSIENNSTAAEMTCKQYRVLFFF